MKHRILLVLLVGLLIAGCGDNELGVEKVRPNQPPETVLSSGPPDSTDNTLYRVQLFWSGTDRDGTVNHYDFILIDHPPIRGHIDGDPNDDDSTRVAVEVPRPDDPRWVGTAATDSTFITVADSLRRDPRPGPGENDNDVRAIPFERWHTFFVRAVDNEGAPDLTPDYRSFNSNNLAPTVGLRDPIEPGEEFTGPPVVVFNWDGDDPVDESSSIEPVASRFVNITSQVDISRPGSSYTSFPDSLYDLPDRFHWSEWKRWDLQDGSGRRAVVTGLRSVGEAPGVGNYIFAVQAMDEAGAITPVFDYQTPNKNNVALYRVSGAVGPILTVREEFLGTQTFGEGSKPIKIDVAGGQEINFRWSADASHYGGEIVAYRYGWDIRNIDNDQEWSSWSLSTTRTPPQSFSTGSHRFFVQVRDNAESISQGIYELTVHTVTRSRNILWVDDTDYLTNQTAEDTDDARWLAVLTHIGQVNGLEFDPILDYYDVNLNRREPPPIQKVFDYKAVVWSCQSGRDLSSGLRRAAQFFDPIPQRNRASSKAFNFMSIYLGNGGAMWINGFRPAKQLWPDERERGKENEPVNVTNWDDPIESHVLFDSIGTTSLLYQMGIEMFDVGSALDAKRVRKEFYCYGFERCAVAGVDSQRTNSSTNSSHGHFVYVRTADIEALPPASHTYRTSVELSHSHEVTLSAADIVAIKRGQTVVVQSTSAASPEPHTHTFTFVDQLGQWGAPALLVSSAWSQAGTGGRTNVEIYNMPIARLSQRQPLIPLPGISLDLYCYIAQAQEDPSRGYFYPDTSDNQPALILAKGRVTQPNFSRAFCGFDPSLLELVSHEALAQFILVRHFRLGTGAN